MLLSPRRLHLLLTPCRFVHVMSVCLPAHHMYIYVNHNAMYIFMHALYFENLIAVSDYTTHYKNRENVSIVASILQVLTQILYW